MVRKYVLIKAKESVPYEEGQDFAGLKRNVLVVFAKAPTKMSVLGRGTCQLEEYRQTNKKD